MKNNKDFDFELQEAFNKAPDWVGSSENMWKSIEERLPEKKRISRFRNTRMTASALIASVLFLILFGKGIFQSIFSAESIVENSHLVEPKGAGTGKAKKMPPPSYLNWNINLNLKNETAMPGENIKLEVNSTVELESIKLIEKLPTVIITRLGTSSAEEKVEEIPMPELMNKSISKGETIYTCLNIKAPKEPGVYYAALGEMKVQYKEQIASMSGGGTRFTVLALKSEVHMKTVEVNKEVNAHENIINIKSITMNEKETIINYIITSEERHADCLIILKTDTGKTLYSTDWKGREMEKGMNVWVSFNSIPKGVKKLYLEVGSLSETTTDGVKAIEGSWQLEVPIN